MKNIYGLTTLLIITLFTFSFCSSHQVRRRGCFTPKEAFTTENGLRYEIEYDGKSVSVSASDSNSVSGDIKIPISVKHNGKSYMVTSIELPAFINCSRMTSITIPNSVIRISKGAFRDCSHLESIIVSPGNAVYDSRDNCNAIIETASNTLIVGCSNTIIPSSVTAIRKYAFWECTKLTSVTIPKSVSDIEDLVFDGCIGLETIIVSPENPVYDSRDNCNAIIETSTNTLIAGCKNSKIPNSVTAIGDYAFWYCSKLASVTIPKSVTYIGSCPFWGCNNLGSIRVSPENPHYDSRENCNAIIETSTNTLIVGCKNSKIPNSVTSIDQWAFEDCEGLTSVTIPESMNCIGHKAFSWCSGLTSVVISENVDTIDSWAFIKCPKIKDITCKGKRPAQILSIEAFDPEVYQTATVHVPKGCLDLYTSDPFWKEFKHIIEE